MKRLLELSEEVSRIAGTLARLSIGPEALSPVAKQVVMTDQAEISAETVSSVIRARRRRGSYFPEELFGDPAWDMMLDLLHSEILEQPVSVSSLCMAAEVPATTALRWMKTMVQMGMFIRRADADDRRRVFVELAPEVSGAMRRYFAEIAEVVTF